MLLLTLCRAPVAATEFPRFDSDRAADLWVRRSSPAYRRMAETVDQRGGYEFRRVTGRPGGLAYTRDGRGYVELHDGLEGARRVSILIFELVNLFQEPRHQKVADLVRRGELESPTEFALLRERVEYDSLRLHRDVLVELERVTGTIPPEMITWASSTAKSFAEYQLPCICDYIEAQAASGHTAHYHELFRKHRAEHLAGRTKRETTRRD